MHQLPNPIAKHGVSEVEKEDVAPTFLFLVPSSQSITFQFLKVNAKEMMSISAVSQGSPVWGF